MLAANMLNNGAGAAQVYSDDVFASYVYGGNATSKTINNGIDLAGKGGLVWVKPRTTNASGSFGSSNYLVDTIRGLNVLQSDSTAAQSVFSGALSSFDSNGFTVTTGATLNGTGERYVSWCFRRAAKFFDIISATGSGAGGATFSHALGITPGLVIVKETGISSNWYVWHNIGSKFNLNGTAAGVTSSWPVSSSSITIPAATLNGAFPITVYAFADDSSTTGLIRCGSFTTDGSGNATVTAPGWEPQFGLIKASSTTGDWIMLDTVRGWSMSAEDRSTLANSTAVESTATDYGYPTSDGFVFKGAASTTYIYMAIRRPNKPPTTGTQVLGINVNLSQSVIAGLNTFNGSPAPSDLLIMCGSRTTPTTPAWLWADRLRGYSEAATGSLILDSSTNAAEVARNTTPYMYHTASTGYLNFVPITGNLVYRLGRAAGVFDIIAYRGTGATQTHKHNLGAVPELVFIKARSSTAPWRTAFGLPDWTSTNTYYGDFTAGTVSAGAAILQNVTNTSFEMVQAGEKSSGVDYIVYLFKTLDGVSKVGTYIGNGSSQNIECGLPTGARLVLIRIVGTGDWFIWDTVRGIVAGNDPHLSLNSTAAEVTTNDSIDPYAGGFAVNQVAATNINVNTTRYLFLAIA